jgi:hypothetical protein
MRKLSPREGEMTARRELKKPLFLFPAARHARKQVDARPESRNSARTLARGAWRATRRAPEAGQKI